MKRIATTLLSLLLLGLQATAQLSNAQIMKIKEDADDGKNLWIKLFEESRTKANKGDLIALRKANEEYLNQNTSQLGRMFAEGDGRELITAVKNYLTIEKQFVKSVMIPAETLSPEDADGYEQLNKKISEFVQKERAFEIDIHNALRSSPEPMNVSESEADDAPDADTDETDAPTEAKSHSKKKQKLPHENYSEKKSRKKKNKNNPEGEEE